MICDCIDLPTVEINPCCSSMAKKCVFFVQPVSLYQRYLSAYFEGTNLVLTVA